MIGDTDFFLDLMQTRRAHHVAAVERARELESQGVRIVMTAITRFELSAGIAQFVEPAKEREKVRRLIRAYPTYALDGPAGDHAGAIHGTLRARGMALGTADSLIAAIALENREPLLTRNRKDFSRVQGLTIETY